MESIEYEMDTGQTSDNNIIEIRDLTKRFGKKNEIVAVDSLTLDVGRGEVFMIYGEDDIRHWTKDGRRPKEVYVPFIGAAVW